MKQHQVGAINWGLVSGKTQTIYPWDNPLGDTIQEVWHHDIFYPDGKPFSEEEISFIKNITKE